jgi:signal transduction histidine kinase
MAADLLMNGAVAEEAGETTVEGELSRLLVDRMRFASRIVIGVTFLYAILDVLLGQPHRMALHGLEAVVLVFAVVTLLLPRFPRILVHATPFALLQAIGVLAVIGAGSILRDEVQAGSTLMVVTVLITAAILPWGLGPQAVVAVSALGFIIGIVLVDPSAVEVFTREPAYIIAIGLGLGCSIPLARQFRRARVAMFREHERLRAAQAEISAINAVLERRVEERTAELEAAITDLRAFGYAISHDLRQPLRSISSFAQIVHDSARERLLDDEKDFTDRIRAAALRMNGLLDEFLRLSRVASQRMQRERVNLSARFQRIAADFAKHHPERSVQWEIQDGLSVDGDPELLTLVLEELADNAWKFTEGREDACIAFGAEPTDGDGLVFFVEDNGCGFEPGRNEDVFKVFSRAIDGSEAEGFGTGLAGVERIIKRHGGRIWAEGYPDDGAVFRFTIRSAAS